MRTVAENAATAPTREHDTPPTSSAERAQLLAVFREHDLFEALESPDCPTVPVLAVPADYLGPCERCPADDPLGAVATVATRAAAGQFTARHPVCAGCVAAELRAATRPPVRAPQLAVWLEVPTAGPVTAPAAVVPITRSPR